MSLSERFHRSVERALGDLPQMPPTPIKDRLYADIYAIWRDSRGPAVYDLHDLLMAFNRVPPRADVDVSDAEQIRDAYGIQRRDAK